MKTTTKKNDAAGRAPRAPHRVLWRKRTEAEEGHEERSIDDEFFNCMILAMPSPDLGLLVLGDVAEWHHNGGTVALWDVRAQGWRGVLVGNSEYHGETYDARFTPDGATVIVAPVEEMLHGKVRAFRVDTGARLWGRKLFREIDDKDPDLDPYEPQELLSLSVSGDGRYVAVGSQHYGRVRVLHTENGKVALGLRRKGGSTVAALSRDGGLLATGSDNGVVRLWDVRARRRLVTRATGAGPIEALAFSPDDREVVAVTHKPALCRLNVDNGALSAPEVILLKDAPHVHLPPRIAFGPSGLRVLFKEPDSPAVVLDGAGQVVLSLPRDLSGDSAALSPDGRLLVTASLKEARVWAIEGPLP